MAWLKQGQLKAQGPRMFGSLIWGGGWYNPPTGTFHRLVFNSGAMLRSEKDFGGVVVNANYLKAPVDGWYLAHAVQCWGVDSGPRGCGLGSSSTRGDDQMVCWADIGLGRFCTASAVVWLPAGKPLYPWTWSDHGVGGMSPADRGIQSRYSLTLLAQ